MFGKPPSALATIASKIDVKETFSQVIHLIDNRHYSACAQLLKEGKLGTQAFLIGSTLEGIIKVKLQSNEAHMRLQVTLLKLVDEMRKSQDAFKSETLQLAKNQQAILQQFNKENNEKLEKITALIAQLQTENDEKKRQDLLFAIDALRKAHKITLETQASNVKALGGIDSNYFNQCNQSSENMITAMLATVQEMGQQNSENLSEMLSNAKSILSTAFTKEKTPGVALEQVTDRMQQMLLANTPATSSTSEPKSDIDEIDKLFLQASSNYGAFKSNYRDPTKRNLTDTNECLQNAKDGYNELKFYANLSTFKKKKVESRLKKLKDPERHFKI